MHVGALLIVVEPTPASARTAARVAKLARGLGLRLPGVVVNKARSREDEAKVLPYLGGLPVIATLPVDARVEESEAVPEAGAYVEAVEGLRGKLISLLEGTGQEQAPAERGRLGGSA
jgi:CO dehydrogenase nickel-insertion accessory protein CooC1